MDTLKRRHTQQTLPDSPPPRYSDSYALGDPCDAFSEKDGKFYKPQKLPENKALAFLVTHQHTLTAILLTLVSFWTRFRQLEKSKKVVWDEAHFGKFGSFYLRHEFYFDVHPPLGKMLVGLSGVLANYNGSFSFESGKQYPDDLDYVTMRLFSASWGALLVPAAYITAYQLNMSKKACFLAACMVLFDNALLTISRFILLDSMLMFFTCTTFLSMAGFRAVRGSPFSLKWWSWLAATGFSLGCVLSVKWVGLFAVALVGLYTLEDLWDLFGDVQMPKMVYATHWIARAACLILIPAAVYIASFVAHFKVLNQSGPGDGTMGSLFQASLNGSTFKDNPFEVAYGANVTIRNFGHGGGLLHSHPSVYPEGSKQQQITCYGHKDSNNQWRILKPRELKQDGTYGSYDIDKENAHIIHDGDFIRLFHINTKRNLHTHPISAPLNVKQWEVSGYGNLTMGDDQDNWRVEIVSDVQKNENKELRALTTRFRLFNIQMNCYLASHKTPLPQWGFKQNEVYCDRQVDTTSQNTWWNVEDNAHKLLPPAPENTYKTHFFENFKRLNIAMWNSNNALIPDSNKKDQLASAPSQWPFASVGLRMCGWDKNTVKFYLMGNPTVWWSSIMSIGAFMVAAGLYAIRQRRKIIDMTPAHWSNFCSVGRLFVYGWFLHYIPFYMMGRVTYLHHYFPALYFSIFMVPFLLEHFTSQSSPRVRNIIFSIAFTLVLANFIHFSPFSYGMTGDVTNYASRCWFKFWNLLENRN